MKGISINPGIGLGDTVQFSSLPENYFKATGEKLYDVSKSWIFDFNPYVDRTPGTRVESVQELWNFGPRQYLWPRPRRRNAQVYLSNAEIWAAVMGVGVSLNRPRLYQFEDVPFEQRQMILLHTQGRSQGLLPDYIIQHVIEKYGKTNNLYQIGTASDKDYGIPIIETPNLWALAHVVSRARLLIGPDSGPSWVAACYPDVVVKKVRSTPQIDILSEWVPLDIENIHAHWDDRCHQVFNISREDVGFTSSYLKL